MKIFDITGDSYTNEIENYNGTVLIDFFSANCMPCKMISPVIEKVADKTAPQVKVCKVDVEKERDLAKKFGIMSVIHKKRPLESFQWLKAIILLRSFCFWAGCYKILFYSRLATFRRFYSVNIDGWLFFGRLHALLLLFSKLIQADHSLLS